MHVQCTYRYTSGHLIPSLNQSIAMTEISNESPLVCHAGTGNLPYCFTTLFSYSKITLI